jgi:hypothetical protein
MTQVIVQWLRRALGLKGPSTCIAHTTLPAMERVRDALTRGASLRRVEPSDLSAEFQSKLLGVCRADPNVAGMWLGWMSSSGAEPELLASLILDRADEPAIRAFIERANALGGPSFVVGIPDTIPSAKPFYRRECASDMT